MAHKKKGRKIYTYHARNHRIFSQYHPLRSAVGTAVTLVLVGVLGFVGYNIVGPVVTRINAEAQSPTTTPEPYFTETAATTTLTTTTVSETTQTTTTTTVTAVTETTAALKKPGRFPEGMTVAAAAPADAAADLDKLEESLEALAAKGYTTAILQLKQEGGSLQYASGIKNAQECGASNIDMLTLREISNSAKHADISLAASVSMLNDHLYPEVFSDGSYIFTTDNSTRWYDNKIENGGKPWLCPRQEGTKTYLSDIVRELDAAGYPLILCTDLIYPNFFNTDANYLGNWINDPKQRQEALVSVLNAVGNASPNACACFDLKKAIKGEEEALQPDALTIKNACVTIDILNTTEPFSVGDQRFDPSSLGFEDRVKMLRQAADLVTGNMKLIPCIRTVGLSDKQLDTVIAVLKAEGCDTVLLTDD